MSAKEAIEILMDEREMIVAGLLLEAYDKAIIALQLLEDQEDAEDD